MRDGLCLPSVESYRLTTQLPTYHPSKLVSFLDRALRNTIEVTESSGLDSHYLPWPKCGRGVDLRRTPPTSGGPAGVAGHGFVDDPP